jgi:hypothetical protein
VVGDGCELRDPFPQSLALDLVKPAEGSYSSADEIELLDEGIRTDMVGHQARGKHAQYDLTNPRRLASMYETVLREATAPDDLARLAARCHSCPAVAAVGPVSAGTPTLESAVPRARRQTPVRGVVVGSTPPVHHRLAEIGLRVLGPFGFALAGGYAIAAHDDIEAFPERRHCSASAPLAGLGNPGPGCGYTSQR